MKFSEYPFHDSLLKGIAEMGFEEPTPVQAETFNLALNQGKDVEAQSQTGTGKTAAFLISAFQLMLTDERYQGRKLLVVAPTRELADQIEKEAKILGKYTNFRIGAFYGGVGYGSQEKLLADGIDVIIGTPGRLLDFSGSGKIDFGQVGVLVIDEADRLFDMGFYPDMRQMLKTMSPVELRRTFLFSATMSTTVTRLVYDYLKDPGQIIIEPEQVTVEKISQELYHVGTDEKFSLMLGLVQRLQAKTMIIFTNTKNAAVKVAKKMEINGYTGEYLIGDLPQSKRLKIIESMKKGELQFLVATDVAARGLHIEELDLVVNYDLPTEAENYVHRIGRTARAGKSGKAISLACEKYVYGLKAIEDFIDMKIPVSWFSEGDLGKDMSAGMRISLDLDDRIPSRDDRAGGRGGRDGRSGSRDARGPREGRSGARDGRGPKEPREAREPRETHDSRSGGRRGDKPMVIRSSSLVNEITGSKVMKDDGKVTHRVPHQPHPAHVPGNAPRQGGDKGPRDSGKPRSRQGEKIAAAAAAVTANRPARGGKPQNDKPQNSPRNTQRQGGGPQRTGQKPTGNQNSQRRPQGQSSKDRLAYYQAKYGDNFKGKPQSDDKKPGVLDKILGFFGIGKKK